MILLKPPEKHPAFCSFKKQFLKKLSFSIKAAGCFLFLFCLLSISIPHVEYNQYYFYKNVPNFGGMVL